MATFDERVKALKAKFDPLPQHDAVFTESEDVVVPGVTSKKPSPGKKHQGADFWHSIRIELLGYVYDVEREGKKPDWDEEPQFIATGRVDSDTKVSKTPATAATPEVDPGSQQVPARTVRVYNALDDGNLHGIEVISAALDTADSVWKDFLAAIGNDITTAGTLIPVPLPAGQQSVNGLINLIKQKVSGLGSDDVVGGDKIVFSQSGYWIRPDNVDNWIGLKWVVFGDDPDKLFYVTLWRITLTGDIVDWQISYSGDPGAFGYCVALVDTSPVYAAAIRYIQGQSTVSLAKTYGVEAADIQGTANAMLSDRQVADEGVRKGLLAELFLRGKSTKG